jgi:hypothetical protein
MLHAKKLSLVLPGQGDPRSFAAPLPPYFRETLGKLQNF